MSDFQLYSQISSLPLEMKKQVSDFITSLKKKSIVEKKNKERQFGYAKGFFKMADDFDEPLN